MKFFEGTSEYQDFKYVLQDTRTVSLGVKYTYEELLDMNDESTDRLLEVTDLLIDGRYEADKRDLTLRFRGSGNQRIIHMNKTREAGSMVLAEEYM